MNLEVNGLGGLIQLTMAMFIALWLSGGTVVDRPRGGGYYVDTRRRPHMGESDEYPRNHRGR